MAQQYINASFIQKNWRVNLLSKKISHKNCLLYTNCERDKERGGREKEGKRKQEKRVKVRKHESKTKEKKDQDWKDCLNAVFN